MLKGGVCNMGERLFYVSDAYEVIEDAVQTDLNVNTSVDMQEMEP